MSLPYSSSKPRSTSSVSRPNLKIRTSDIGHSEFSSPDGKNKLSSSNAVSKEDDNAKLPLTQVLQKLQKGTSTYEDIYKVLTHSDFLGDIKRLEPLVCSYIRSCLPILFQLALGHTNDLERCCPSLSKSDLRGVSRAALQAICGRLAIEQEGTTEAYTASCGPVWDDATTQTFFKDCKELMLLVVEDVCVACDRFESLVPSVIEKPLQRGPRMPSTPIWSLHPTERENVLSGEASFNRANKMFQPEALYNVDGTISYVYSNAFMDTRENTTEIDLEYEQEKKIITQIRKIREEAKRPILRPTLDELEQFIVQLNMMVYSALQIFEAILVAAVQDRHSDLPNTLGSDGLLGLSKRDVPKFKFFDNIQKGQPDRCPTQKETESGVPDDALKTAVQYAIQAFTHVFLSTTVVQQQLRDYRNKHHSSHRCPRRCNQYNLNGVAQFSSSPVQNNSDLSSCSQPADKEFICDVCDTFNEVDRTTRLALESFFHVLKLSAIAFVAHDQSIAEAAIEVIDSKGPVFIAQATMLLAHVLTPELMAAHPPHSRGGSSLQWILGYVFGGLSSDDVERRQKERKEELERCDSNPFSLANSSASSGGGSWDKNSSRRSSVNNDSASGSNEEPVVCAAELRVEYILASCFTRCHSLMTVIGVVAESDAYNCGTMVAQAVLQYAFTLSLTSNRLLRTPLLTETWTTPITEAMMQRINDLAMMDDNNAGAYGGFGGGDLLGSPVSPASSTSSSDSSSQEAEEILKPLNKGERFANERTSTNDWTAENCRSQPVSHFPCDTDGQESQEVSSSPLHSGSPPVLQSSVHGHDDGIRAPPPSLPERTRDYLKRNTKAYRFHPRPTTEISGTTPAEMIETATNRTTRRCLALHWAKCILLSGRRMVKSGNVKIAIPREHYHNLNQMSKTLEKLLEECVSKDEMDIADSHPVELESAQPYKRNRSKLSANDIVRERSRTHVTKEKEVVTVDVRKAFFDEEKKLLSPLREAAIKMQKNQTHSLDSVHSKDSYKQAFVKSFCCGKKHQVFETETPFVMVPIHEVVFASLFKILKSCGDILLCEVPRLNSIFLNELLSLLYEIRLTMLEFQADIKANVNCSTIFPTMYSESTTLPDKYLKGSYWLLFPLEYKIIIETGLQSKKVLARWTSELEQDPNLPMAGFVQLLNHIQKRLNDYKRPDVTEFLASCGTLRLLLGVSTQGESLGAHGTVLHVDDLDVEGTKKEHVAPKLGVTCSKDVMEASEDDLLNIQLHSNLGANTKFSLPSAEMLPDTVDKKKERNNNENHLLDPNSNDVMDCKAGSLEGDGSTDPSHSGPLMEVFAEASDLLDKNLNKTSESERSAFFRNTHVATGTSFKSYPSSSQLSFFQVSHCLRKADTLCIVGNAKDLLCIAQRNCKSWRAPILNENTLRKNRALRAELDSPGSREDSVSKAPAVSGSVPIMTNQDLLSNENCFAESDIALIGEPQFSLFFAKTTLLPNTVNNQSGAGSTTSPSPSSPTASTVHDEIQWEVRPLLREIATHVPRITSRDISVTAAEFSTTSMHSAISNKSSSTSGFSNYGVFFPSKKKPYLTRRRRSCSVPKEIERARLHHTKDGEKMTLMTTRAKGTLLSSRGISDLTQQDPRRLTERTAADDGPSRNEKQPKNSFNYVRQLIESGAFGLPKGNKSFSFLQDSTNSHESSSFSFGEFVGELNETNRNSSHESSDRYKNETKNLEDRKSKPSQTPLVLKESPTNAKAAAAPETSRAYQEWAIQSADFQRRFSPSSPTSPNFRQPKPYRAEEDCFGHSPPEHGATQSDANESIHRDQFKEENSEEKEGCGKGQSVAGFLKNNKRIFSSSNSENSSKDSMPAEVGASSTSPSSPNTGRPKTGYAEALFNFITGRGGGLNSPDADGSDLST